MTFEIDLKMLEEAGLTPDEFIYLECQRKKIHFNQLIVNPLELERHGFIKITEDGISLRSKYLNLVEADYDRCWREFCNTYPFKVGTRILHTHDPDAASNKKLKEKYLKIIKNKPHLHKKIVKAVEIMLERQRFNLQYLQNLETFINQLGWEKYFHELDSIEESKTTSNYGNKLK
jgi:hypothetical protein